MTKRFYHIALSAVLCLLTLAGCKAGTDAQEAAQYRKNFRAKLESSKQLTLPYKLRMDISAPKEDPSYRSDEYDQTWLDIMSHVSTNKNFLSGCECLIGYLPDTSKFFTLIGRSRGFEDNIGYILTFDKNCELISSQYMNNHSSVEYVEDVLTDENYFTIDNDLKICYYFHKKTYYEDDAVPIKRDGEEEYENHGYIDSNGVIVYDTINEVTLKYEYKKR